MYEVFERLCKENGVNASIVSRETGISTSTFSSWKRGEYTPKQEKLKKVADYFGVTLEYLMTGKDTPVLLYTDIEMGEYNAEVRKLMEVLNNADIDTVRRLRYYAEGLLAARKDQS